MIDFTLTDRMQDLKARTEAFIRDEVIPMEGDARQTAHGLDDALRNELMVKAKAAGLLSPHVGKKYGGLGCDMREMAIVFEAAGDLSRLEVDFLAIRDSLATRGLVQAAHRREMQVHVWTVNREADMATFIDRGVDNLLTDHPALARRVLADREALSRQEKILLAFRNWWWR